MRTEREQASGSTAHQSDFDRLMQQSKTQADIEFRKVQMEHESIMSAASVRKRDTREMMAEIEAQIDACPEFAAAAIYSKPVGTVCEITCKCGRRFEVGTSGHGARKSPKWEPCPSCGKEGSDNSASSRMVQKRARNLSIRAAEAVAEIYGFNRLSCGVQIVDSDHVKVTARFFDYANLRTWEDEALVPKFYTTRDGQKYRHAEDRFHDTIVKAAKSKLIREVIIRSVPAVLRLRMFAKCEEMIARKLGDDDIDKIVKAFAEFGVTQQQLETYIGRTRKEGWTKDDRLEVATAYNGLKSNETTVAELFGDDSDSAPVPTAERKQQRAKTVPLDKPSEAQKSAPETPSKPRIDMHAAREALLSQTTLGGLRAAVRGLLDAYAITDDQEAELAVIEDERLRELKAKP